MDDKLARTYSISLLYSTSLLHVTVIHWSFLTFLCIKFHLCLASHYCVFLITGSSNYVQAEFFVNNFGLYINSQQNYKYRPVVCCCKACCLQSRKSKSLLHFCKFFVNAGFDLITSYLLRKKNKHHFQWYICQTKYYKVFTHKSNTLLF